MATDPYAVDNASLGTWLDQHPCGPTLPLGHSYIAGVCEDCGEVCEHDRVEHYYGHIYICLGCGEHIELTDADLGGPDTMKEWRGDA